MDFYFPLKRITVSDDPLFGDLTTQKTCNSRKYFTVFGHFSLTVSLLYMITLNPISRINRYPTYSKFIYRRFFNTLYRGVDEL